MDHLKTRENTPEKKPPKGLIKPEKISFYEDFKSLLLDVNKKSITIEPPLQQLAETNGLETKKELHITAISFANGTAINQSLENLPDNKKNDKISQIKQLIENADWNFSLKKEMYHIKKDYLIKDPQNKDDPPTKEHRESYIQMISMPEIEQFYSELNKLLDLNLEVPPTHITLFTKNTNPERSNVGIAINSKEEFTQLNPQPIEF